MDRPLEIIIVNFYRNYIIQIVKMAHGINTLSLSSEQKENRHQQVHTATLCMSKTWLKPYFIYVNAFFSQ